jgi:hypothetical protein
MAVMLNVRRKIQLACLLRFIILIKFIWNKRHSIKEANSEKKIKKVLSSFFFLL